MRLRESGQLLKGQRQALTPDHTVPKHNGHSQSASVVIILPRVSLWLTCCPPILWLGPLSLEKSPGVRGISRWDKGLATSSSSFNVLWSCPATGGI